MSQPNVFAGIHLQAVLIESVLNDVRRKKKKKGKERTVYDELVSIEDLEQAVKISILCLILWKYS